MELKKLVKISTWGAKYGISRQGAYKNVKRHGIPMYNKIGHQDPVGHYLDEAEADRIWEASRNPAKQRGGQAGGDAAQMTFAQAAAEAAETGLEPVRGPGSPLSLAQLALLYIKLRKERTTVEEMEGKVVPLPSVRAFESLCIAAAKSQLLPIGAELCDDLAHEHDPVRCQQIIDNRIVRALTTLAAWRPE